MSEVEVKAENLGGESILEAPIQVLKSVGDAVNKDEPIFIIESDKTSLEVPSPENGIMAEIFVKNDEIIKQGQILAKITTGSTESSALSADKTQSDQPRSLPISSKDSKNDTNNIDNLLQKKDAPAARKMMKELSIDPTNIKGTGLGERITKSDVLNRISKPTIIEPSTSLQEDNHKQENRVKMSTIRKLIADRLKESQNTAAILTTFNEIDMKNVMDLRAKYKDSFEKKHGVKLGFMSFFTKAVILALREIPEINAEISGDEIIYKEYYDIGIAVGTDKGLVVPVIHNASDLSFAKLESTLVSLGKKAREGKLQVSEMSGATFTITNGGVYGSLLSTPIINPPQSGILGMHAIQNRPVAIGNSIEIRPMMYVALSYDHRIVDGKGAVTFLVRVKQYIEDPSRMFLAV